MKLYLRIYIFVFFLNYKRPSVNSVMHHRHFLWDFSRYSVVISMEFFYLQFFSREGGGGSVTEFTEGR